MRQTSGTFIDNTCDKDMTSVYVEFLPQIPEKVSSTRTVLAFYSALSHCCRAV